MKKLLFIVAALFVAVSFSACSDDDKDSNNDASIIGTWKIVDDSTDDTWPTGNDYYTYTFRENGTASLIWYDGSNEKYDYSYTLSRNILTMVERNSPEPLTTMYEVKDLTTSHLVLFLHEEEEGRVYETTLTFEKI